MTTRWLVQGEPQPRRALVHSDSDNDGAATKPRRVLAIESDDEDSDTSVLPAGQQMRAAIDLTRDGELTKVLLRIQLLVRCLHASP